MLIIPNKVEIGKPFQEGLTCYLEGSVFEYNSKGCFLLVAYSMLTKEDIEAFYNGEAKFEVIVKDDILLFLNKIEGLRGWSASAYNCNLLDQGVKPSLDNVSKGERIQVQMILVDANIGLVMGLRTAEFSPELTNKLIMEIKKQSKKKFDKNKYYINLEKTRRSINKVQMI